MPRNQLKSFHTKAWDYVPAVESDVDNYQVAEDEWVSDVIGDADDAVDQLLSYWYGKESNERNACANATQWVHTC